MCCSVPSGSQMLCSPRRISRFELKEQSPLWEFLTPDFILKFKAAWIQAWWGLCALLWFAVCSREHPLIRDKNPPTEVVPSEEWHLVGHRVLGALISSNNLVISFQRNCRVKKIQLNKWQNQKIILSVIRHPILNTWVFVIWIYKLDFIPAPPERIRRRKSFMPSVFLTGRSMYPNSPGFRYFSPSYLSFLRATRGTPPTLNRCYISPVILCLKYTI